MVYHCSLEDIDLGTGSVQSIVEYSPAETKKDKEHEPLFMKILLTIHT